MTQPKNDDGLMLALATALADAKAANEQMHELVAAILKARGIDVPAPAG